MTRAALQMSGGLAGLRFSCAPPKRGGHTDQGNKHVLSIPKELSAQPRGLSHMLPCLYTWPVLWEFLDRRDLLAL